MELGVDVEAGSSVAEVVAAVFVAIFSFFVADGVCEEVSAVDASLFCILPPEDNEPIMGTMA